MKQTFSTKRLCRAGVIAALYVAMTYAFMPFAFGPIQVRPAEALCILPLFFVEAVPALYVGCMLSNLASPFLLYDVLLGSLVTLVSAFVTYLVGTFIKNRALKFVLGGLSPVVFNTLFIPLIAVFLCSYGESASAFINYVTFALSLFVTESVWVLGLGTPLYCGVEKLQKRGVRFFEK